MDNNEKYIIKECRFCGNKTKLDIVGSYKVTHEEEFYNEDYNEYIPEWISDTEWMMLKCCVCDNISLGNEYVDKSLASSGLSHISIEYPKTTYDSYQMPKEIYGAYEVALKARYLDGALCILSLRRTLEIICKEQGEIKGDLITKVKNLADKGILPSVLKDVSHILRIFGNAAAHGDDISFTKTQIEHLIEFTETIIDYIYILPKKLEKLKNNI